MESPDHSLYVYEFYGCGLRSSIALPFLDPLSNPERARYEITFDVDYVQSIPDGPVLTQSAEGYIITFGDHACYKLSHENNRFEIRTKSTEILFSTMFNLPVSIFLANKGGILLHCSSFIHDKSALCFCGNKGVGKSTWISMCLDRFPFFSDDTLAVFGDESRMECKAAGKFIKLHEDSAKAHGISEDQFRELRKNTQGKAYVDVAHRALPEAGEPSPKAVFHLSRYAGDCMTVKRVNSDLERTAILLTSIVGMRHFNGALLDMVRTSEVFNKLVSDVPFFRLYLPRDLGLLRDAVDEFSDMLPSLVG